MIWGLWTPANLTEGNGGSPESDGSSLFLPSDSGGRREEEAHGLRGDHSTVGWHLVPRAAEYGD